MCAVTDFLSTPHALATTLVNMFSVARFIGRAVAPVTARSVRPSTAPVITTAFRQFSLPSTSAQRDNFFRAGIVEGDKTSVVFETEDRPGALEEVLRLFWKHDISLTRIESKPPTFADSSFAFHVDFTGVPHQPNVQACMRELGEACRSVYVVDPATVPWFPTRMTDIDGFSRKCLDAGAELEADHPGFSDEEYRERRRMIVEAAQTYKFGDALPHVDYTDAEKATWKAVYEKLRGYTLKYAVKEYNDVMQLLEYHIGFTADDIPQLADISDFLHDRTGFTLRPVGGLLSARDFLNGLAFKVFFSTQYIRHHSMPLYTPEPDIVHELLGHAPMFADPDFARFSHEIGLASLGASDEDIKKLATCYWFSVEFGMCRQDGAAKAYGAGLLSSFGELEYACSPTRPAGGVDHFPEYKPWEPEVACFQEYPITCYQPIYFVADSLDDACVRMRDFCNGLRRPFHVSYDAESGSVWVDKTIVREEYKVTLQSGESA